jgi:hypothetical protein
MAPQVRDRTADEDGMADKSDSAQWLDLELDLEPDLQHLPANPDVWVRVAPTWAPPPGRADRRPFAITVHVRTLPAGLRLGPQKAR